MALKRNFAAALVAAYVASVGVATYEHALGFLAGSVATVTGVAAAGALVKPKDAE